MGRLIAGIIVTSIALYVWGFVVWGGAIPYQTEIWKAPADGNAAGPMLKKYFPENGTYVFPANTGDMEADSKQHEQGPVAFVHMLKVDGHPMFDSSIMINGFILNFIFVSMVAALLWCLREGLTTYKGRFLLIVAFGLIAAIFVNIGDAVWWQIDFKWKLYQAFYTLSACTLTGAILGAFIPKSASDKRPSPLNPSH